MARITIYKNSILASIISIFSYLIMLGGIMIAFDGEILGGILLFVAGVGVAALAAWVSQQASFRKWIKKLKKDGIIDRARTDGNLAVQIYNANPKPQTLKYLRSVNPAAAEHIARQVAAKK